MLCSITTPLSHSVRPRNMRQLLLRAALDLVIAACVHVATVWTTWRLLRKYIEPTLGQLQPP